MPPKAAGAETPSTRAIQKMANATTSAAGKRAGDADTAEVEQELDLLIESVLNVDVIRGETDD